MSGPEIVRERCYIPRCEFARLFGGHVISENASKRQFLGVWGRRKCQTFRRILRERGAEFTISRESPSLRLRVLAVERENDLTPMKRVKGGVWVRINWISSLV